MWAVSEGSVITAPASHGGGGGVKGEQALYTKRSWEDTRKRNLPGLCSLWDGKPGPQPGTPPHTNAWRPGTHLSALATCFLAPKASHLQRSTSGTATLETGSEWVSEAHTQICFLTNQNRGQQKQERSDPENTYISEHALRCTSACKGNQVTETTSP